MAGSHKNHNLSLKCAANESAKTANETKTILVAQTSILERQETILDNQAQDIESINNQLDEQAQSSQKSATRSKWALGVAIATLLVAIIAVALPVFASYEGSTQEPTTTPIQNSTTTREP